MSEAAARVDEFCRLYRSELRGSLDDEDRPRLLELTEQLRELIDGASGTSALPLDKVSMSGQDALREILGDQAEDKPKPSPEDDDDLLAALPDLPLGGAISFDDEDYGDLLDDAVGGARAQSFVDLPSEVASAVSSRDRGKLRAVRTDLPSGYTPPVQRGYLADYFGSIEPAPVKDVTSGRAVRAAGGQLDVPSEVLTYFGVQAVETEPEPDPLANIDFSRPPPPAAAPSRVSEPPLAPGESPPRPIAIYLLTGAVRKGETKKLDPETGFVKYMIVRGMPETRLPAREVREIHFAPHPGIPLLPPGGQRLTVTLSNGQRLTGFSPDYAPGVTWMNVIPDPRPHNIDYIWIPAWAVQGVQLG